LTAAGEKFRPKQPPRLFDFYLMPGHHQAPCDEGVIQAQIRRSSVARPLQKKQARLALAATVLGSSMAFIRRLGRQHRPAGHSAQLRG
jgi:hypothetical protein